MAPHRGEVRSEGMGSAAGGRRDVRGRAGVDTGDEVPDVSGWIRIEMVCGRDRADMIEEALAAAGAVAVSLEDAGEDSRFESWPPVRPIWDKVRVSGLFPKRGDGLERLAHHLPPELRGEVRRYELPETDWVRVGRDRIKPMRFGDRLWVSPTWADLPPEAGSAAVVRLDPGLAFGAGSHPSTRLCLRRMVGQDLVGRRIVDYGCGSGILGIAALRLGAKRCLAVDVDPVALEAARANAVRNGVGDRFDIMFPEEVADAVRRAEHFPSDLLAANILADPLAELPRVFGDLVAPGGEVMLAGILSHQAGSLIEAYAPWFRLAAAAREEDWILLAGPRIR